MAEYIEREAAIKVLREKATANSPSSFYRGLFTASYELDDIPAADVALVRHGRWEKQSGLYSYSECGRTCPYDVQADVIEYWVCNYCPNCGAKMDLEEEQHELRRDL